MIKAITSIDERLRNLLAYSISDPSDEKIDQIINSYSEENLIGYYNKDQLVGFVGVKF